MLQTDRQRMNELIKAFHTITGIKIAIYDEKFEEITAYPLEQKGLCSLMYGCEKTKQKCFNVTAELFKQCQASDNQPVMHKCHAGLTEVAAPLTDGSRIIGYVIFGQITTQENTELFVDDVCNRCSGYGISPDLLKSAAKTVKAISKEQIDAISFVLSMITSYITSNRLVYSVLTPPGVQIKEYILKNLSRNLSIDNLCKAFSISRSGLYNATKQYMPDGISNFIKEQRIMKAKKLLRSSDSPIWKIAEECGFNDAEYFMRCFKKETGLSTGQFRKEYSDK